MSEIQLLGGDTVPNWLMLVLKDHLFLVGSKACSLF